MKVTLTKPHTHAGTKHAAGATIDVNDADRQWLTANGVIVAPKASNKQTKHKESDDVL